MLGLEFNTRQLCMDLFHADTEEQVINILDQGITQTPGALSATGQITSLLLAISLVSRCGPS